jgi:hypothetical protein
MASTFRVALLQVPCEYGRCGLYRYTLVAANLSDLPPGGPGGPHGFRRPLARRARPVPPRRRPMTGGARRPGHVPRAWKDASGQKPAPDLPRAPSRKLPGCSTWVRKPSVTSESLTGPPDQPVNGRLACAGGESARLRLARFPRPAVAWRGVFSCAGVPGLGPLRRAGYLVPVPSDWPVP